MNLDELIRKSNDGGIQLSDISPFTERYKTNQHTYELTTHTHSRTFTLRTPNHVFKSGAIPNYPAFYTEMMSELPKLVFTIQECIRKSIKIPHSLHM